MICVGTSEDTWCLAGPVAILSLLCGKIWSLGDSGPCFGGTVATGQPQETHMKGNLVAGSS